MVMSSATPPRNAGAFSTAIFVMSGSVITSTTVKMTIAMMNAAPSMVMSGTAAATNSPIASPATELRRL